MFVRLILIISFSHFVTKLTGQQAEVIKYRQLDSLLSMKNDTTYVINFWATWCKPCVEEMPYFLKLEKESKNLKRKFIYISLDFKRQFETRLMPFLKERNITSDVYLLDEPDYDSWIDKVDPKWQGNIPATLIYNYSTGKRTLIDREVSEKELRDAITNF